MNEYELKLYELKCGNAVRNQEEKFRPVYCNLTNKRCVCCSCDGCRDFKMNPWYINCPGYSE